MAASIANLVHETSTTTGSGNFTLAGASNGAQSFNSAFGTGGTDKFYYFISNQAAAEWEVGTGHLSAASTLVRDTVINSSNANAAVVFSSGTKDVTCDLPATLQGKTTATSLAFTLDTDGTPLDALTLGGTFEAEFAHILSGGSNSYPVLALTSTASDASSPWFAFFADSSSPAASDPVGFFQFRGRDSAANTQKYASIDAAIVDPTSTSEDGSLSFTIVSGGSDLTALTLGTTGTDTSYAHIFDLGGTTDGGLEIVSTSAANIGPEIFLRHNSASPAASDIVGLLVCGGKDSAANNQVYSQLRTLISDPTSGSEDAYMDFRIQSAGSFLTALTLGTTSPVDGSYAHQFDLGTTASPTLHVTSTGQTQLNLHSSKTGAAFDATWLNFTGKNASGTEIFWASINSYVTDATAASEDSELKFTIYSGGANLQALTLGTTNVHSKYSHIFDFGSANQPELTLQTSSAGTVGPDIYIYHNSASPAVNDTLGQVIFAANNGGAFWGEMASISVSLTDVTAAAPSNKTEFWITNAGTEFAALTLGTTDPTAFGAALSHVLDFGSTTAPSLVLQTSSAGVEGPAIVLYHNSASPAASDITGSIEFYGKNSAAADKVYGEIITTILDATSTSEDSSLIFNLKSAGSTTTALKLDGTALTTASAANAFIDNAASNTLKRSTSSGKYKTAINTIQSEDAVETLSALRPVRYRSAIAADPQDKEFYGLIAEEVNEIDPQLVHFNENGEPDGVQYDRVPVLLLAAYRELSNRLKELENAQVRH